MIARILWGEMDIDSIDISVFRLHELLLIRFVHKAKLVTILKFVYRCIIVA